MSLTFSKIIFTFRLKRDITKTAFFFTKKSSFSDGCRKIAGCRTHGAIDCSDCTEHSHCFYPEVFAQSLATDPAAVKRYQKPSLPFVFQFPSVAKPRSADDVIELGLVLLGGAAVHFESFLEVVRFLWADTMLLVKVESLDSSGNRYPLMDDRRQSYHDNLFLYSSSELMKSLGPQSDVIAIKIISPLRLIHQGELVRDLCFGHLIRALFRRVSSVTYYYGGAEMDYDYKELSAASTRIKTVSSNVIWTELNSPHGKGRIEGLTGDIVFSGDLHEYYPFLQLGEYFNLGKGATFGLGRYTIC